MKTRLFFLFLSVFCFVVLTDINAQINLKQKIKDKVTERADKVTDEAIDKTLDKVEEGAKDAVDGKDENEKAEAKEGEEKEEKPSKANNNEKEQPSEAKGNVQEQPTLQSSSKYDFVPGDKILLFEDFSQDAVGDFPALWTTNGSGEVNTVNLSPGHWFHLLAAGVVYQLEKPFDFPENFIFEFDVIPDRQPDYGDASFEINFFNAESNDLDRGIFPGVGGVKIICSEESWEVRGYDEGAANMTDGFTYIAPIQKGKLNHLIIWVQKRRVRIYHLGQKAVDLPTALNTGQKLNHLRFSLWSCGGFPYITNLRFTTAAPDVRSKLLTEGKLVCYGIYFDVNSDKVKPESYGSLNEIANVLKENPTVKINIVGHTDSDGDDAANLDLSKRRAASVKNELAKTFGIDASRIQTDGKGESQPVAPNDTPANKAKNRRVEFIKL
jgi:outer membrane protein OmpA-like peptidoglycan-associated protein